MLAFEYFHSERPNTPTIWIMDRAQGFKSARPLVDNENYNSWPSWSPDSKWISFMAGKQTNVGNILTDQIYKVRVSDGTVVQLTDFPKETVLGDSTSWSSDGRIAFEYQNDIYAVNESGGTIIKILDLQSVLSQNSLWGIAWSPDSAHLAFRGTSKVDVTRGLRIWVADAAGQHVSPVTQGPIDENPSWYDSEHLLFERWNSDRSEVRVCAVCLQSSNVHCLTQGHLDLTPVADPTGRLVFFARGESRSGNPRSNSFLPPTHIFVLDLRNP